MDRPTDKPKCSHVHATKKRYCIFMFSPVQHIESTIAGILLEVVLKLSSLTDSDIFLIVEDAGRRSWMGRRRFREAFLDGSLTATPIDVEWTLENGDRIVRRQGGMEEDGDDADVPDEAMTTFVSPSKKPVSFTSSRSR